MSKLIIAIAGGSASGKSSISKNISNSIKNNQVLTLCYDDYYKDQSNVDIHIREKTNYDHPDAFDLELFLEHLAELKNSRSVKKPIYDYSIHNRSLKTEIINPTDVIVIEGLFVLTEPKIRNLCDILVFVDTDADLRFLRRVKRDVVERNRSIESVCNQYQETVRDMHELYVQPSKQFADIIIAKGIENTVAIDLLCTKINSIIDKS